MPDFRDDFDAMWTDFVRPHLSTESLVWGDDAQVSEPIRVTNLEINGRVSIQTNDRNALIEASGLIIAETIILKEGASIRANAPLRIFAREVKGPIYDIDARGEDGPDGQNGTSGAQGANGNNGSAGANGRDASLTSGSSAGAPGGGGGNGGNGGTDRKSVV